MVLTITRVCPKNPVKDPYSLYPRAANSSRILRRGFLFAAGEYFREQRIELIGAQGIIAGGQDCFAEFPLYKIRDDDPHAIVDFHLSAHCITLCDG